jgi:hypothetical protein
LYFGVILTENQADAFYKSAIGKERRGIKDRMKRLLMHR